MFVGVRVDALGKGRSRSKCEGADVGELLEERVKFVLRLQDELAVCIAGPAGKLLWRAYQ